MKLTIVTFNIHGWLDFDKVPNFSVILKLFESLKADIIFFQEVDYPLYFSDHEEEGLKENLEYFAKKYKMHLLHAKYECGLSNAILSIFPMTQKWTFPLEVDKREARVLIGAELQISESFSLPVFNTHLDHVFEELRLLQMDIIHSTLKKILPNQPFHILGGDFNSINVEDYPNKKWNSIKEYRIKNSWELPFSDVYNRIVKDWKYLDTYRVTNQKEYPPPSCWAGTRIDYIFFSPEFNGKILKCETVKTKASDHQPILVEFEV